MVPQLKMGWWCNAVWVWVHNCPASSTSQLRSMPLTTPVMGCISHCIYILHITLQLYIAYYNYGQCPWQPLSWAEHCMDAYCILHCIYTAHIAYYIAITYSILKLQSMILKPLSWAKGMAWMHIAYCILYCIYILHIATPVNDPNNPCHGLDALHASRMSTRINSIWLVSHLCAELNLF